MDIIASVVLAMAASFALISSLVALHMMRSLGVRFDELFGVAQETRTDVDTSNVSDIGELAAADETRRVADIDYEDRTAKEQRHLDDAPAPDPPQGPKG